jgi:hypothetical protein
VPRLRLIAVTLALALTAACSSTAVGTGLTTTSSRPSAPNAAASTTYPAHCTVRDHNQLPDPVCTPGAVNPNVTQANLRSTICRTGFTAEIRPRVDYTERIKRQAVVAYGAYAGSRLGNYELDHLISLELGGAPDAVTNLWPEKGLHNAKDPVENAANRAVCSGRMTLADAQQAIASNWITLGHRLGVAGIPAS